MAWYYLKQALISMRRNLGMGVASVATIAVALLILGGFVLIILNASRMTTAVESQMEIAAFLKVDASQKDVDGVGYLIRQLPGVSSVELVTKEQGLAQVGPALGGESQLLAALGGENPLPDYYRVKVERPEQVIPTAQAIARMPHVDEVRYGQGTIEKLLAFTRWLRLIGTTLLVALSLAAVFLVANTIRISVYAKKREISVMRYVGATNWFIRWPFIIEGFLLGALGGGIAVFILMLGYQTMLNYVQSTLNFIPWVTDPALMRDMVLGLVALGAVVGVLGSIISMRRYLEA